MPTIGARDLTTWEAWRRYYTLSLNITACGRPEETWEGGGREGGSCVLDTLSSRFFALIFSDNFLACLSYSHVM